jgi:hypothetical protein
MIRDLSVTVFIHPGRWELIPWWGVEYTWLCVTVRVFRQRRHALVVEHTPGKAA